MYRVYRKQADGSLVLLKQYKHWGWLWRYLQGPGSSIAGQGADLVVRNYGTPPHWGWRKVVAVRYQDGSGWAVCLMPIN